MAEPVSNLDTGFSKLYKTRMAHSPATPQLTTDSQIALSKDIQLNSTNATFLRLYRPLTTTIGKIPVIIYFHGGGFILLSATSSPFHNSCSAIAAQSPSLVISVEYRLAPEHRLPAAYDDAMEALLWVRDQALGIGINNCDEWLTELADFSKLYLMGSSSGGNIVYNASLRALDMDLDPIKIIGIIMDQPFFGGIKRTASEHQLVNHRIILLMASDLMWSLALPQGSDRDHEYCNPLLDQNRSCNEKITQLPRCLIRGFSRDPLVDRQKEFANMLEAHGVQVTRKFRAGGYHGLEFFDAKKHKSSMMTSSPSFGVLMKTDQAYDHLTESKF